MLEILYQDDDIVAVNKPANLAVHRSTFVGPDDAFLVDLLREQVEGVCTSPTGSIAPPRACCSWLARRT